MTLLCCRRRNSTIVPQLERLEPRNLLATDGFGFDFNLTDSGIELQVSLPGFEFSLGTGQPQTSVNLASPLQDFAAYQWTPVNEDASWSPRAGLQVVELKNHLYLMGGRTPLDPAVSDVPGASLIWDDVWQSNDQGATWEQIVAPGTEGQWPARAYFQAVTKGPHMYVLGGQNFEAVPNPNPSGPPFISTSEFFNDVWRSRDGVNWTLMTSDAAWAGRAGLSSVVFNSEIYVLGGSFNDDAAVVGGQPERVYFNDVWKSRDGSEWELVTDAAPWTARAGAQVVVKDGYMYLLGGEDGFTCESQPRCPPYFNDVWRSRDGENWELVTESAAWSPRPGHHAVVVLDHIVLFGGFGLSLDPADPFKASNPMDVWVSRDGATWQQVSDSPWNASSPEEIKYDFDALTVWGGAGGFRPSILTFGGDRETFNFADPTNFLNVDNDVWRFSLPASERVGLDIQIGHQLWHNRSNPLDVNDDGLVTPLDALMIINDLNSHGARLLPLESASGVAPYLDTNGDGYIAAVDVLLAVNELNRVDRSESEAGSVDFPTTATGPRDNTARTLSHKSLKSQHPASLRRRVHNAVFESPMPSFLFKRIRSSSSKQTETEEPDSLLAEDLLAFYTNSD